MNVNKIEEFKNKGDINSESWVNIVILSSGIHIDDGSHRKNNNVIGFNNSF